MVRKNILSTFLFLYFSPAAIWDNKSICNKTLPCKLYVFDRYTAYYTVKKQDEMFVHYWYYRKGMNTQIDIWLSLLT